MSNPTTPERGNTYKPGFAPRYETIDVANADSTRRRRVAEPIDLDTLEERLETASSPEAAILIEFGEGTWHVLIAELRAARKVVEKANQLLAFPNKSLIPWTEWSDFRYALAEYERESK